MPARAEPAPIRWGIFGTGRMARAFAADLARADGAVLAGVGSRDRARADEFSRGFPGCRAFGSYRDLACWNAVDVIYIATPHTLHHEHALLALDSGKHVLCEKPFTINLRQARDVTTLARERGLFCMEAMWTRFVPAVARLREMLSRKAIGDVQLMIAGGAFIPEYDPDFYLFNPQLGGGVLLDAGVYLVSMASMVFGPPRRIMALGEKGRGGVDEHEAMLLQHAGGAIANLYVSLRARSSPDVMLLGERGRIRVHPPMFGPKALTVSIPGREEEVLELPFEGGGYQFQAIEVMECLRRGETESHVMPLDETLRIMGTMDTIRAQLGMRYSCDRD